MLNTTIHDGWRLSQFRGIGGTALAIRTREHREADADGADAHACVHLSYGMFSGNSVREKDWRCGKRGTQATRARQGDAATVRRVSMGSNHVITHKHHVYVIPA